MSHRWRVAWTIARRDYVAAVFSRLFVFFLLLPLIFGLIGGLIGQMAGSDHETEPTPVITVSGDRAFFNALTIARNRSLAAIHGIDLPPLVHRSAADPHGLLRGDAATVVSGDLDHPRMIVAADAPDTLPGEVSLIVEEARAVRALRGATPAPMAISHAPRHPAPARNGPDGAKIALAKGAQYAVLVLTVLLAGRLLSSFVEERSNKIIEVLAAAAPVEAIFLGKLVGMLLFALTCIAAWGTILLVGAMVIIPETLSGLPMPAIGLPLFVPLMLLYFTSSFLLFGAVMLGIGAQASSPADIQTLALPTTLAQLVMFGFASFDVARPDHWVAQAAAIFPWSSSLAMVPRAAEGAALWPHLLALAWQAAWVVLTLRFVARRFRIAVLKSGGGGGRRAPSSAAE